MDLLTPDLRDALIRNAAARRDAYRAHACEPDPPPVVKFFNPVGAATWLATELDSDGDTLFGLADLGFGCPELGSFSLSEIAAVRLPLGLSIERDLGFASLIALSLWADTACATGSTIQTEAAFADAEIRLRAALTYLAPDQLPPSEPDGGRRCGRSPQSRKPVRIPFKETRTGTHKE
ncbi:hypothetical protein ACVWZA_004026 [Sphingomonas sp. UYAg733]